VLVYPTAPIRLRPSDIPGFQPPEGKMLADLEAEETDNWGWFRRNDATGAYDGFAAGMRRVAAAVREAGGVDGVLGFSQGGAMAAWVAAALEPRRALPAAATTTAPSGDDEESQDRAWAQELREANGGRPLRFAVVYSGFAAAKDGAAACRLEWLYAGDIQTPTLHFIGGLDTVVDENRSRALIARCRADRTRVVVHPGGHYVPVSKEWTNALVMWLREVLAQQQEEEKQDKKEDEQTKKELRRGCP
jgi:predicted esterase